MTERWRDVAHIGHAELLTPDPEASLDYFTTLLGLTVVEEGDLMNDATVAIEAGPSRHIPIQGFYLYTREPGGNRIEICSGGYLGFDPDDAPVIWTPSEYAAKPGWGARLPSSFRHYGTPPSVHPRNRMSPAGPPLAYGRAH